MTSKTKQVTKHKEGSRKSKVHALFDKQGQDAAWTLGLTLKLSQNTLRSWFGTWRREATPLKRKPAKAAATLKAAKRSGTPKPTATPKATETVTPLDQPETIPQFLNG